MKVKNGMASSSWFSSTPKIENVRLPMKFGWISPSSSAISPKNNPTAASENAAG